MLQFAWTQMISWGSQGTPGLIGAIFKFLEKLTLWCCNNGPALPQLHRGQSAVRQELPYWLTMTTLLEHSKAQLTEYRFLPQKLILQNTSELAWSDLIKKGQKITKIWFSKSIFYLKNPFNHSEFDFLSKMLD